MGIKYGDKNYYNCYYKMQGEPQFVKPTRTDDDDTDTRGEKTKKAFQYMRIFNIVTAYFFGLFQTCCHWALSLFAYHGHN